MMSLHKIVSIWRQEEFRTISRVWEWCGEGIFRKMFVGRGCAASKSAGIPIYTDWIHLITKARIIFYTRIAPAGHSSPHGAELGLLVVFSPLSYSLLRLWCCRYVGHVLRNVYMPGSGIIWLDNVQCRGCENDLDQCPHRAWGSNSCSHRQDVSIACYERSTSESTTTTTTTTGITRTTGNETTAINPGIWIDGYRWHIFPVFQKSDAQIWIIITTT